MSKLPAAADQSVDIASLPFGQEVLAKNDRGFCVFGYEGKEKKVSWSLRKVALDMKMPLKSVKPLA